MNFASNCFLILLYGVISDIMIDRLLRLMTTSQRVESHIIDTFSGPFHYISNLLLIPSDFTQLFSSNFFTRKTFYWNLIG